LLPDGIEKAAELVSARSGVSLHSALQGRAFWFLTLGFGLASLSAAATRVHFIPFLIEAGVNSSTAAFATGAIGIMQVLGRVVFAPLDHRLSSRVIVIGVFAIQSLGLALLLVGQTPLLIGSFIMLFGAAQGAATLVRPSMLAELYGVSHYARISSVMAIFLTLTGTSAPLGASLLYDRFGGYQPVLWLVFVLALAATIVVFLAKRHIALASASPFVVKHAIQPAGD
jgi:predicted MFS family arabinose efflux permease